MSTSPTPKPSTRGQRAQRVARLVQVLRFVRGRQGFLDQPGDLAAFWSYYNDLSENEQEFETPGDDRIGGPSAGMTPIPPTVPMPSS